MRRPLKIFAVFFAIMVAVTAFAACGGGVSVTGISLDREEITLYVGEEQTLTATISPADADDKGVTWTTSDPAVATVEDGKVTAVAAGTATVTVKTNDGAMTAACAVTVQEQPAASSGVSLSGKTYILVDIGEITYSENFPDEYKTEKEQIKRGMAIGRCGFEFEKGSIYYITYKDKYSKERGEKMGDYVQTESGIIVTPEENIVPAIKKIAFAGDDLVVTMWASGKSDDVIGEVGMSVEYICQSVTQVAGRQYKVVDIGEITYSENFPEGDKINDKEEYIRQLTDMEAKFGFDQDGAVYMLSSYGCQKAGEYTQSGDEITVISTEDTNVTDIKITASGDKIVVTVTAAVGVAPVGKIPSARMTVEYILQYDGEFHLEDDTVSETT